MGQYLGEFEQLILLAMLHLGDNAYGVTIQETIEQRTGRQVSVGAVYTTLERLRRKGMIDSSTGAPSPQRGGRRKKLYQLLPAGREALRLSQQALRSMTRDLGSDLGGL